MIYDYLDSISKRIPEEHFSYPGDYLEIEFSNCSFTQACTRCFYGDQNEDNDGPLGNYTCEPFSEFDKNLNAYISTLGACKES